MPRFLIGNSGSNKVVGQFGGRFKRTLYCLSTGTRRPSFYELYSMYGHANLENENTIALEYVFEKKSKC